MDVYEVCHHTKQTHSAVYKGENPHTGGSTHPSVEAIQHIT